MVTVTDFNLMLYMLLSIIVMEMVTEIIIMEMEIMDEMGVVMGIIRTTITMEIIEIVMQITVEIMEI